ncbi:MAG: cysteine desulfurase [Immundisolibacteraceae bacterium]|nr:cysteine desulfurase [Immundisolibacteraceae bacterium]
MLGYFDYAATTPVDPAVAELVYHCMTEDFGNPSSLHHADGKAASRWISLASEQVARLINATPESIVYTSGATEANNLAIFGAADFYQRRGRHLVCAATEHASVITPMQQLQRKGYQLTLLKPDSDGIIDPDALSAVVRKDTLLVSIQHANNETGVLQNIAKLADRVHQQNALFHVDAAQSIGKIGVDVEAMNCDLLSLSGHKIYGPMGIGALYVRRKPRVQLTPQLFGGGQQGSLRPGTLPTQQIAGLGKACEIAAEKLAEEQKHLWQLHHQLLTGLNDYQINGHPTSRLPGIVNISHRHTAQDLLTSLADFSLANGSACNASQPGPSHVLLAMGLDRNQAANALRISFGRFTSTQEMSSLANALGRITQISH